MTQEQLALLVGAAFSLAFSYLPFLKDKFEGLSDAWKQGVQWIVMAVLVFGAYGLSCAGLVDYYTCNVDGFIKAVVLLVTAIVGNAGVYVSTKYLHKDGAA